LAAEAVRPAVNAADEVAIILTSKVAFIQVFYDSFAEIALDLFFLRVKQLTNCFVF
jgi:hypothetical protein